MIVATKPSTAGTVCRAALAGLSLLWVWSWWNLGSGVWKLLADRERGVALPPQPSPPRLTERAFGVPSAFPDELYHSRLAPYRDHPCQPERIHLAQASDPLPGKGGSLLVNMTVSFTLPYAACADARATVSYGRGWFPEGRASVSERVAFRYDASVVVPNLTDYQSDWIHHVVLEGLEAGRQHYWYKIDVLDPPRGPAYASNALEEEIARRRQRRQRQVEEQQQPPPQGKEESKEMAARPSHHLRGGSPVVGETPVYSFLTPPVPHQPTALALVGDLGQTENSTKTMHHIFKAAHLDGAPEEPSVPVSALLLAGDLSYADGDPYRWESWLELMEPLLRSTPLNGAVGNHEVECDNTTNLPFGFFENYFRSPNRIGPADIGAIPEDYRRSLWGGKCVTSSELLGHYDYGNAFYTVEHGLARIVVLNSYTSVSPGSAQYEWLEKTLAQADSESVRQKTPWLLVMFHCPLRTTFKSHVGEINSRLMLKAMEPLFVEYGVNLVLSGHDHAYLRTKPIRGADARVDPRAPVYVTVGAGGNREQHTLGYLHPTPEDWVATRDNEEYGYGHLFLANATHAHWRWVRDGTTTAGVRDTVWWTNSYFAEGSARGNEQR